MMNELAHNKKHVLKATMIIMFIAMVASFVVKPVAAAQDKDFRESPSSMLTPYLQSFKTAAPRFSSHRAV